MDHENTTKVNSRKRLLMSDLPYQMIYSYIHEIERELKGHAIGVSKQTTGT
jgi:hypothetical protein